MKKRILRWLSTLPLWGSIEVLVIVVVSASVAFASGTALQYWSGERSASTVPLPSELPVNGGFEVEAWTRDTLYWTPDGGPYSNPFGEIYSPYGWTMWWREGFPCATGYTFEEGRPEVQVIDLDTGFPDEARIRSGTRAVKQFTYWRCHEMGLLQQVNVEPGGHFDLSAYGHAWHTNCSSEPHSPPLDDDCVTPLPDSWDLLQIGVDPYGGLDPHGSTVIWSTPVEQYGMYGAPVKLTGVEAVSGVMTVFLRSECNYPLRHNDVYWDDVQMERVERVYLPLIIARSGRYLL